VPVLRVALIVLAALLSVGVTGAGPDMTTEARCSTYALHGTDTASNLLDACDSVTAPVQSGANPFIPEGGATCTNASVPAHLDSSRRSCNFDDVDDVFRIPDDTMPNLLSLSGWNKPANDDDFNMIYWHKEQQTGVFGTMQDCIPADCLQFTAWTVNKTADSPDFSVPIDAWSYVGSAWTGNAFDQGHGFVSNSGNPNTLLYNDDSEPFTAYLDPARSYVIGGVPVVEDPDPETYNAQYLGQMVEVAFFGEELTAGEHCSVCRCSVGNMNPRTNGVTGWLYDASGSCNDCVFDLPQTHCGPRRVM